MLEHPGDERVRLRAQPVDLLGAVEAVGPGFVIPEREVQVTAVSGGGRPGLRRERGDESVPAGDATDRLADVDLLVGSLERPGM